MADDQTLDAFVFARRGELLALPAVVLALAGKPSAFSVAVGLPLAFIGEAIRLTDADRICIPVPLYHCFGIAVRPRSP